MRNPTFDIMKGISIIAVIIGHCPIPGPLMKSIFAWHLPLFFFVSGYIFKQTTFETSVTKNAKALIKPYLVTCAVYIIYICLIIFLGDSSVSVADSIFNIVYGSACNYGIPGTEHAIGVIWFLLSLFWARLTYNFILKSRINGCSL